MLEVVYCSIFTEPITKIGFFIWMNSPLFWDGYFFSSIQFFAFAFNM